MARAPKPVRERKIRKIELDPTKPKLGERRRLKAINADPASDPMERAAAIALLGKSVVDDTAI